MIYIKCYHCESSNPDFGPQISPEAICKVCGLELAGSDRILKGANMTFSILIGAIIGSLLLSFGGTLIGALIGFLVSHYHPDKVIM